MCYKQYLRRVPVRAISNVAEGSMFFYGMSIYIDFPEFAEKNMFCSSVMFSPFFHVPLMLLSIATIPSNKSKQRAVPSTVVR
jgi:hypothetical protein